MAINRHLKSVQEEKFNIYTLGRFQVFNGSEILSADSARSRKVWDLLMYFVAHRGKPSPPEIIAEALWPRKDYANPAGAVKSLVHRLRQKIDTVCPSDSESFIVHNHGCYGWNTDTPCWLDVEAFEHYCTNGRKLAQTDPDRACEQLFQALKLYQGDFLPEVQHGEWVLPVRQYYRHLFIESMAVLLELLKKQSRHARTIEVCKNIFFIENFEEIIHLRYMEALLFEGKTHQARDHYQYISSLFYQKFEVKPSAEMKRLYRTIRQRSEKPESGFSIIRDILEKHDKQEGALFCEVDFFKDLCKMERRRAERDDRSVHVGLLTLDAHSQSLLTEAEKKDATGCLSVVLSDILRKGDVFTLWDEGQFAVILPGTTREQTEMILKRSTDKFKQESAYKDLLLRSSVHPIIPFEYI